MLFDGAGKIKIKNKKVYILYFEISYCFCREIVIKYNLY